MKHADVVLVPAFAAQCAHRKPWTCQDSTGTAFLPLLYARGAVVMLSLEALYFILRFSTDAFFEITVPQSCVVVSIEASGCWVGAFILFRENLLTPFLREQAHTVGVVVSIVDGCCL